MSEDTPASSPALDHLGPGVSAKIREAIKAKLVELSVYVDDELPDYIMVMVANRKSPDQMKQDLGLFLNEHNQVFVDWLDHVLQKLQKVAQEGRGKKKVTKKKVKKEDDPPRKTKTKKTPVRSELKHEEYDPVTEETHRRKREKSARSRSRSPLFSDKDRDRHSDRDRDRHSDRDRDRHSVRDRDRHLDRDPDRHSNRDPDRYSRSSRRSDSRPSHTRDRDHRPVAPRQLGSRQSPGRHFSARRRSPDPSNNSSPPRRGPSSVIGAVISHDSDGEYDPEQILKRALVASKVQVARPPPPKVSANKNLVLKAVADADRSLKRRRIDERDRDLKAVHEKRALLSQARRAGNLDDQTLKAITRDRSPSPMKPEQSPRISRKPVTSPVRRSRSSKISRESRLSRKRDTTLPRIKGMRADEEEEKQQVKTKKPPIPSQSSPPQRSTQLGDLDLRYHLGQRKLGTSLNTLARQSGLTIKVRNDLVQTTSQDPKLSEQDEDDPNIETMRQKALESMRKGTLRRSASQDEKKIIIPLNEESGEDDTDCDESAADKETVDGSSSSSDSVPPKLDPSKRPPASAKDPQFIVTLQGIDKKYFKKAKNQSAIPPPPLIVSKSVDQSKTTVALSKKPEAKVAPSVRSETKPLRKRITAPEPDPVALPSLPLTSVPAIAFAPKTAVDRPICKYWPRCSRGDSCFFFHPKSNPSTNFASSIHQKPTISRIPSKEKLTWTAASAKPI